MDHLSPEDTNEMQRELLPPQLAQRAFVSSDGIPVRHGHMLSLPAELRAPRLVLAKLVLPPRRALRIHRVSLSVSGCGPIADRAGDLTLG